jgi:hypothetical protein
MLYKFKSQATGDLIMLEGNGRRVLEIIGKDAGPKGIILAEQVPAALAALDAAVQQEESAGKAAQADADDEVQAKGDGVTLRQRVAPFADMLRRAAAAGKEVVWGV